MTIQSKNFISSIISASMLIFIYAFNADAATVEPKMDSKASKVPYDSSLFNSDPEYDYEQYDVKKQLEIYGGKKAYDYPSPLIELGNPLYGNGPIGQSSYIFGDTNPVDNQFYVYGDWRTAVASNDNGVPEQTLIATTLNLDMDWRITGTERLHALFQPLQDDGRFTRYDISGDVEDEATFESDLSPVTLFFEGDLGNIISGFGGGYSSQDIPFAFGLMPLLVQNGVWLDDAFTGIAATIPHMNSKALDISNMDVTFFAGFDKVNTPLGEDDVNIYGINTFIEANQGYWEAGYGFTEGTVAALDGQDYHNLTIAFTRRYFGTLSNSVRVISNFGQDDSLAAKTADGTLLLLENSWITSLPLTLIPYFNFFYGDERPQSLAREGAAGGVLKNTGINFESDNLTGYPTLDATANNTAGGAIGLEYLFDLRSQIVVEVAAVIVHGDDATRIAKGDQFALGVRYQRALTSAWILRADAMTATLDNDENLTGARVEIRRKF